MCIRDSPSTVPPALAPTSSVAGPAGPGESPEPERLDVVVHRPTGGVTLVQVTGAVEAGSVDEFALALRSAAATTGPGRLVLDLTAVRSLAPEALDELVRTDHDVAAAGGTIELHDPSGSVVLLLHDAAGRDPG